MDTLVNIMVEKRKCSVVKCLTVTLGITGAGKTTWLRDKSPVVETDVLAKPIWGAVTDKLSVTEKLNKSLVISVLVNDKVGVNVAMLFFYYFSFYTTIIVNVK